jgi:hypothetical protein
VSGVAGVVGVAGARSKAVEAAAVNEMSDVMQTTERSEEGPSADASMESLCIACKKGLEVAFTSAQLRTTPLCLHAYHYQVTHTRICGVLYFFPVLFHFGSFTIVLSECRLGISSATTEVGSSTNLTLQK